MSPGRSDSFRYSFDSPSAACRHSLSGCVALYGKEIASATAVLKVALDVPTRNDIERTLSECADIARSEVLLRHEGDFASLTPTADECKQWAKNARSKGMTWAMQLGTEMHEEALECVEERLSKLRPGGFSLEPRYRYDSRQNRWKQVSREEEQALDESGNSGELKGSVKPDVVIHQGDPLRAQAVYDFKFPCMNIDEIPNWPRYPPTHPYSGLDQGTVYEWAFSIKPTRVMPRLGVIHE
ncbi:hypothetical protein [Cystobacter fuscus]|uniref:hypothetical protein n=1 Tax=Cystobacter fuscus TaxID=43 RepID=UPI0037BE5D9D